MLLPLDQVWGSDSFTPPVNVQEEAPSAVLLEEKVVPASISIPLPTLPTPETIQSTCNVLMVILLFFILLELKHLAKLLS